MPTVRNASLACSPGIRQIVTAPNAALRRPRRLKKVLRDGWSVVAGLKLGLKLSFLQKYRVHVPTSAKYRNTLAAAFDNSTLLSTRSDFGLVTPCSNHALVVIAKAPLDIEPSQQDEGRHHWSHQTPGSRPDTVPQPDRCRFRLLPASRHAMMAAAQSHATPATPPPCYRPQRHQSRSARSP